MGPPVKPENFLFVALAAAELIKFAKRCRKRAKEYTEEEAMYSRFYAAFSRRRSLLSFHPGTKFSERVVV